MPESPMTSPVLQIPNQVDVDSLLIYKSFTEALPVKTEYHLCACEGLIVSAKSDSCLRGTKEKKALNG